jgi:membrane-associated phospholipid phosphatase
MSDPERGRAQQKANGAPQWWVRGSGRWQWVVIGVEVVCAWAVLLALMVGLGRLLTGPLLDAVGPTDNDLARWLADQRTATLTDLAEIGGTGGDTVTIVVAALIVAAVFSYWTRSPRPAVFLLVGLIGQALLYDIASHVVHRDRPPVELLDHGLDPNASFPSGHVSTSIMFFGGCVVLVWLYTDRRWRAPVSILLLVPPVVAVSRLYQGAHYLTDALASIVVIPFWVAAMTALVLLSRPEP